MPTASIGDRPAAGLELPSVTEDDLLAFQLAHFGDDSRPEDWFVDAETALNVQSQELEHVEDDGLGYYEDGVKRTLTDEQIAMFRHSEIQELLRERRLRREEEEYQDRDRDPEPMQAVGSPASDASSLEGDLVNLAQPARRQPSPLPSQQRNRPFVQRQPSQSSKSDTSRSSGRAKRRRQQEIPYDQRNKRKWEQHIEGEDPLEGSITHRRVARELDNQAVQTVDIDYG